MTNIFYNRCRNCGADWGVEVSTTHLEADAASDGVTRCPVCHLDRQEDTITTGQYLSGTELEYQLGELIMQARTSGLDPKTIVKVLQEELGFAAEMAQIGHQFSVQIIDLGRGQNGGTIEHRPALNQRNGFQSGQRERRS